MKLLEMLILLVTLAPDDDEHLMSGMPAVLLVPLIATAVCGASPASVGAGTGGRWR